MVGKLIPHGSKYLHFLKYYYRIYFKIPNKEYITIHASFKDNLEELPWIAYFKYDSLAEARKWSTMRRVRFYYSEEYK